MTVEWARAGAPLAPTRPGGFDETPVGRLPRGPAGDAALAAAAVATAGRPAPAAVEPPALSRSPRDIVGRGAVAAGTALAAAVAGLALVRARRRR